jgi:hypothetical protein
MIFSRLADGDDLSRARRAAKGLCGGTKRGGPCLSCRRAAREFGRNADVRGAVIRRRGVMICKSPHFDESELTPLEKALAG